MNSRLLTVEAFFPFIGILTVAKPRATPNVIDRPQVIGNGAFNGGTVRLRFAFSEGPQDFVIALGRGLHSVKRKLVLVPRVPWPDLGIEAGPRLVSGSRLQCELLEARRQSGPPTVDVRSPHKRGAHNEKRERDGSPPDFASTGTDSEPRQCMGGGNGSHFHDVYPAENITFFSGRVSGRRTTHNRGTQNLPLRKTPRRLWPPRNLRGFSRFRLTAVGRIVRSAKGAFR
jgi:hypothetical protein